MTHETPGNSADPNSAPREAGLPAEGEQPPVPPVPPVRATTLIAVLPARKGWASIAVVVLLAAALALILPRLLAPTKTENGDRPSAMEADLSAEVLEADGRTVPLKGRGEASSALPLTLVFRVYVPRPAYGFLARGEEKANVPSIVMRGVEALPGASGTLVQSDGNAYAFEVSAETPRWRFCVVLAETAKAAAELARRLPELWPTLPKSACFRTSQLQP